MKVEPSRWNLLISPGLLHVNEETQCWYRNLDFGKGVVERVLGPSTNPNWSVPEVHIWVRKVMSVKEGFRLDVECSLSGCQMWGLFLRGDSGSRSIRSANRLGEFRGENYVPLNTLGVVAENYVDLINGRAFCRAKIY